MENNKNSEEILDKTEVMLTNLIWILGDVQYMLMKRNIEELRKKNLGLRHDTKYRFNQMVEAQDRAKKATARFTQDVLELSDGQLDQYYEDSNMMRNIILLAYDRLVGRPDNVQKAWEFLKDLSSYDTIPDIDELLKLT